MTGEDVRAIRKRLGLTHRSLAEAMGYEPNAMRRIRRIEDGIDPVTPQFAERLRQMQEQRT